MFKKRRERKQAELHEELAAALREPDRTVRAKAASDAAEAAEPEWALREPALAVGCEPCTDDFHDTVVDGSAAVLRREAPVRERTERIVAGHLDDPAGFVRARTGFVAELGGEPPSSDRVPGRHGHRRGAELPDGVRHHGAPRRLALALAPRACSVSWHGPLVCLLGWRHEQRARS
ncbi:hypothetical protein [Streptomyces sp. NPDC058308]|uniref:hypothetical protein n=1 Tax=Streptomyces sp. NPDC058308 TaxID=3346440 RepID=UPI0036E47981